jgi:hypothetical protein
MLRLERLTAFGGARGRRRPVSRPCGQFAHEQPILGGHSSCMQLLIIII